MIKGSITVFLVFSLTIFCSAVFAFLEFGRVSSLKANAQMSTMQAGDSLLAEYHPGLWLDYDLLFREAASGEKVDVDQLADRQKGFISENNVRESYVDRSNYYLLSLTPARIDIQQYELATDRDGTAFCRMAAKAASENLAKDAVQKMKEMLTRRKQETLSEAELKKLELDADQSLIEMKRKAESSSEETNGETGGAAGEMFSEEHTSETKEMTAEQKRLLRDNPITHMKKMKRRGILKLVMPDKEISDKSIDLSGTVSHRSLNHGNYNTVVPYGAGDRVLFRMYLQDKFGNAVQGNRSGPLDYQLEYILAGKNSDVKNLKTVVRRLLLEREGINYLFLLRNPSHHAQAQRLATQIAMAFLSPEFIPPIKHGILLSWAFAESVSDLRILLSGGEISLIKTEAEWNTSLYGSSSRSTSSIMTSGDSDSKFSWNLKMDYSTHLMTLLWLKKERVLAYHAMDLIEQIEDCRMDTMISRMDCGYSYRASPIFWDFVWIGSNSPGFFTFHNDRKLSYL